MSYFKDIPSEEINLLISLPYRVGIWISDADDLEKTQRDDRKEAVALDRVIKNVAGQKSFAGAIMAEIDHNRLSWGDWKKLANENNIIEDVVRAKKVVSQHLSKKEWTLYCKLLWHVGVVIAQAFGEDKDPDQEMHVNNFFEDVISAVFSSRLGKTPDNVSAEEKRTLKKLRAALKS